MNCSRKEQRASHTRDYLRRTHLRRKYNTSPEEVLAMLEAQNFFCPICHRTISLPTGTGGIRSHEAAVDHDHKSGRVRGMLCPKCNYGLGCFDDNITKLRCAAEYLGRPIAVGLPLLKVEPPPNAALDAAIERLEEKPPPPPPRIAKAVARVLGRIDTDLSVPVHGAKLFPLVPDE